MVLSLFTIAVIICMLIYSTRAQQYINDLIVLSDIVIHPDKYVLEASSPQPAIKPGKVPEYDVKMNGEAKYDTEEEKIEAENKPSTDFDLTMQKGRAERQEKWDKEDDGEKIRVSLFRKYIGGLQYPTVNLEQRG